MDIDILRFFVDENSRAGEYCDKKGAFIYIADSLRCRSFVSSNSNAKKETVGVSRA